MTYHLYITLKNYSSWSMRLWVLMHACNIPFEETLIVFEEGVAVQKEFLKVSPTALVPCLHDLAQGGGGDDDGLVVWESLAIVEYLAEREPSAGIWPTDVAARAFARSACAEVHAGFSALRSQMSMNIGLRVEIGVDEPGLPELRRDLARLDALWREGLGRFGGPWLAGREFTAADAFYVPVATRLQTFMVKEGTGEGEMSAEGMAYAGRLLGHEASRAWIEDGLKETTRERGHDEETVQGRRVVADYRAQA
ncbi:hypothetical protein NKR23_g7826 [Pleurostoma richardsiae]|uniref:GST N-terminal domain-containing protein n=1 Tax=Pleurostoma richardsiae TaxID=41990 RepID=A0AA38R9S7_9PEZI|nr:hypothetical protein NKR23_g7826 [Pleurostoma richardsiae]